MTAGARTGSESVLAHDVVLAGVDGHALEGYVARPLDAPSSPAVVLVHHAPGWDRWTRQVVRDLAAAGLATLSPHLYSRLGPGRWDELAARARAAGGVADADVVADVVVASAFLRRQPYTNGRVGLIGFCSGGRHAYLAACQLDGIDALVDCWGARVVMAPDELDDRRPRSPIELSDGLLCPVLGIFGQDDRNPDPAQVDQIDATLDRLDVPHEFHRYDGAGHAFMNSHRDAYRPDQALDAWERIVGFLHRTLAPVVAPDDAPTP